MELGLSFHLYVGFKAQTQIIRFIGQTDSFTTELSHPVYMADRHLYH